MLSPVFNSAAALYAALLAAADAAPTDGALKLAFSFVPAPGVRSSFSIIGTREKLLSRADHVRKHWALYGGGPRPAAAPRAPKPAISWPASIIKVWVAQVEDGDSEGSMLTGERIGVKYFQGSKGTPFALSAPLPVDGLPAGFCSARRDDGRWLVAHWPTGLAVAAQGFGSRKAAEEQAQNRWAGMSEESLSITLQRLQDASVCDESEARAAWCAAHNIVDPRADDPAPAVAPEEHAPVMKAQPSCHALVAAAPETPPQPAYAAPVPVAQPAQAAPVAPQADAPQPACLVPNTPSSVIGTPPPAEAGNPPGVQKTRARSSTPGPGASWRRWCGVPPPVESWRIHPAEVWTRFTPSRAKDTAPSGGNGRLPFGGSLQGYQARICGPPRLDTRQNIRQHIRI